VAQLTDSPVRIANGPYAGADTVAAADLAEAVRFLNHAAAKRGTTVPATRRQKR
jgi:hypothetical protein